jgi:high-affinity iron transporter
MVRRGVMAALFVVPWIAVAGTTRAPAKTTALLDRGKASFAVNCAACHGVDGRGNGPVAFAVRPRPRNLRKEPFVRGDSVEQIFATLTQGLPTGTMASYAQLAEEERWALAYYVAAWRTPKPR